MPGLAFEDDEEPGGHLSRQEMIHSPLKQLWISFLREYIAHTVKNSNLISHYLCLLPQKVVKCAKFLVVNSNHCTLEEFITM